LETGEDRKILETWEREPGKMRKEFKMAGKRRAYSTVKVLAYDTEVAEHAKQCKPRQPIRGIGPQLTWQQSATINYRGRKRLEATAGR